MAIDMQNTNSAAELRMKAEGKVAAQTVATDSLIDLDVKRLYHELQTHHVELEMQNEELTSAVSCLEKEISDRKKAEQTLQFERDLSIDIINAQPGGIYRIRVFAQETWEKDAWRSFKDSPHVVELASEPFCKILGTTKEVFENSPGMIIDLIHPDDREGFARKNEDAAVHLHEFIWEGRLLIDGVSRWVRFQSLPRSLKNGDVLWTGSLTDITERKQAEEDKLALEQQFQQAQKLESLGVLAGGIAHDFNNILAIIMGYCSLTKMNYATAEKNIPEMENAVQRGAALCHQMLAYAGKAPFEKAQLDICMIVSEMSKMLQSTIAQNVVIKPALAADVPPVTGDASQIRQVVMNLIINAAEAIGDTQGEVRVSLSEKVLNKDGAEKDYLDKIIPYGSYACLEVADTGCGMSNETYNRIFEPFYTTKFTGRGLGMSAVLGIIKTHNGALQLTSKPGKGTTFKIYLPVQIKECSGEESPQQIVSVPWQGSGTILLVEDEADIRFIAGEMMNDLGFTVIRATNGKEGLELFQKNAADIKLVFTDIGMPVMDGYQLFNELKTLRPDLPIIISSGFGDSDVESRIASEDIAGLISKPYSFDSLSDELKRVVEGIQKQA